MRLNKYMLWIISITAIGTFIQLTESLLTGIPFDPSPIFFVWFFIFGVVPSGIIYLIRNRKGAVGKKSGKVFEKVFNKKAGIGIAAILIIVLFVVNMITYNTLGLFIWDMLTVQPLSSAEVEAKAGTFTRDYPDVIKGNWEPNAWHMHRMMELDVERLKAVGVNTVSISIDYSFDRDGTPVIRDLEKSLSNLVKAKEAGFAVYLTPSFGKESLYDFEKEGITMTKEDFLRISEEVSVRWAEYAEKYAVEYVSPVNEFDGIVHVNFAGEGTWEGTLPEMARVVGEWHKQLYPKMRQVFSGRILTKLGSTETVFAERWADFADYDIIGTGVGHNNFGLEDARRWMAEIFNTSATIAERNNKPWAVLEAWFPIGGPWWPRTTNDDGESLDALHDEYFKISSEEYLKRGGGVGYIFHSWTMPVSPVKDRPAEQVLKDFFSKI